jgi:hypothetical protein
MTGSSARLCALVVAACVAGCGGQSSGALARGGTGDPAAANGGAGGAASGGGISASGGLGGVVFTSGGRQGETGGATGGAFDVDAAIRTIQGISGPGGPCAFTSMTCEGGSALCLCAPGRKWDCGGSPDPASIVLPAREPQESGDCAAEGLSCKGWTVCSPTCKCAAGKWSCVPPDGCVVPSCTGQTLENGGVCDAPGLDCGGGCRRCLCEPAADGKSRWTCVNLVC